MYQELRVAMEALSENNAVHVIIIKGNGKHFTAGLDLAEYGKVLAFDAESDIGKRAFKIQKMIKEMQQSFNAIEMCSKPVIAMIHGACIGAGVDLISACDMRFATSDSYFSIKVSHFLFQEVDLAMAADLGTLQRLPKLITNQSKLAMLVFCGANFSAKEAADLNLTSQIFQDFAEMESEVMKIAQTIASKSQIAIRGIKNNLVYSKNNGVVNGLDRIAIWNSAMFQSADLSEAMMAALQKRPPIFSKL